MKKTLAFVAFAAALGATGVASAQDQILTQRDQIQRDMDRRGYSAGGGNTGHSPITQDMFGDHVYSGRHGRVLGGAPYYRDRQVHIDDWRAYGLERPPRGQRWVRIGDRFMLQRR